MTPAEALRKLKGPLRFGDPEQIAAVKVLEDSGVGVSKFDDFRDIKICYVCAGEAVHECDCGHEHDCERCDGFGVDFDDIDRATEKAFRELDIDERKEVIEYLKSLEDDD